MFGLPSFSPRLLHQCPMSPCPSLLGTRRFLGSITSEARAQGYSVRTPGFPSQPPLPAGHLGQVTPPAGLSSPHLLTMTILIGKEGNAVGQRKSGCAQVMRAQGCPCAPAGSGSSTCAGAGRRLLAGLRSGTASAPACPQTPPFPCPALGVAAMLSGRCWQGNAHPGDTAHFPNQSLLLLPPR